MKYSVYIYKYIVIGFSDFIIFKNIYSIQIIQSGINILLLYNILFKAINLKYLNGFHKLIHFVVFIYSRRKPNYNIVIYLYNMCIYIFLTHNYNIVFVQNELLFNSLHPKYLHNNVQRIKSQLTTLFEMLFVGIEFMYIPKCV